MVLRKASIVNLRGRNWLNLYPCYQRWRFLRTLPLNTAGLLRATIVPKTDYGETMFAKFGNAWLALPAGLLAISFIFNRRKLRIE